MRSQDAEDVARLHAAAMGTSLWGRLGEPFLAALYRALLVDPAFVAFVYVEEGRVRGFIAGAEDVSAVFRRTFVRRFPELAVPLARGLARHPRALVRLAETPLYFRSARPADDVAAESMFCSFEPHLRGKRVSGHINKVLFDELLARGQARVRVTTEVDNEGANRQLRSWGFVDHGEFVFYGKRMRAYVLDLSTSPRVEARRFGSTTFARSE